jgi:hypothetical protein
MSKLRSIVVFFVLLFVALTLIVPAEDMLETAYDESEVLPFECTPLMQNAMPQVSGSRVQSVPGAVHGQAAASRRTMQTPIAETHAHRLVDARVALAILCIHLC